MRVLQGIVLICETGWLFPVCPLVWKPSQEQWLRTKGIPTVSSHFLPKVQKLQPQRSTRSLLLPCQSAILQDWIFWHHETTPEAERLYHSTESRRFSKQELCFFPAIFEVCFSSLLFIHYLLSLRQMAREALSHMQHCVYHTFTVVFRRQGISIQSDIVKWGYGVT